MGLPFTVRIQPAVDVEIPVDTVVEKLCKTNPLDKLFAIKRLLRSVSDEDMASLKKFFVRISPEQKQLLDLVEEASQAMKKIAA